MKKFQPYMSEIGIKTSALIGRVSEIYKMHMALNAVEPDEMLIEDYIDSEGRRLYTCLNLFFAGHFIFSADNFTNKDELSVGSIERLNLARFELNNYKLGDINEKSALVIHIDMSDSPGRGYTFKATRENCRHLIRIYHAYMEPFIIRKQA
jgi:hypothetical protein